MPRSTIITLIIIILLGGALYAAVLNILTTRQADAELERLATAQADRDLHVQIAIRAQQYTLRSYSNELDDSTKMAAFEESQLWLDSLKAGFAFDSKHSLNKP